jgi:hypothetical protein
MGRRGPPPKGEYGGNIGRTAVLSTRLQPDTRARLVAAAKTSKRSLSQELEHRLRRTFIEDDKEVDFYGSPQTAAVLKLVGAVIQAAGRISYEKRATRWLEDASLFDAVLAAVLHALIWFRPGGDGGRWGIHYQSDAERILDEIRAGDPSLPITKRSTQQHAMAMLRDRLGPLADRPHPHDEWRKTVRIVHPRPAERKKR